MKYRFITILHYLQLEKPNCQIPIKIGTITNNPDLISDVLSYKSRLAFDTLGIHSIDEFHNKTYYLVDDEFDESLTDYDIKKYGIQIAFVLLRQIQQVTDLLWCIRDNSVYIRDGFLFVYDDKFDDGISFKASLTSINTLASMNIKNVMFSKEEIINVANEMEIISISEVIEKKKNYAAADQYQYFKNAKIGRKFYAWIYICFARCYSAIPIKLLMYITAMEALVSTSTVELSHQVSERIAVLLGNDKDERIGVYMNVKRAYGFRSRAAHGESLEGTEKELTDFLVIIDNYLRQLMRLEDPYGFENKEMNSFFIEKLMK